MGYAVLFSGGKDSTYAFYLAQKSGIVVDYLMTMVSSNPESYMFHVPNSELTNLHAEAMSVKLITKRTTGLENKELLDLENALKDTEINGLIVGAIASSYQMSRIQTLCESLGLELYAPLWHRNEEDILRSFIKDGFRCIFVALCAAGFDESWLGRVLDESAIDDLLSIQRKYKINISGEGGEYETLVLDGPNFKKKIEIIDSEKIWKKDSGIMIVKKMKFVDKR